MWKIPLFDLNYDSKEFNAVNEVLKSKWLSQGINNKEFEEKFAKYLQDDVYCCTTSSCTSALHLALILSKIKPEDEVIISGLTFVAALNVTQIVGATPVLADSKSFYDWNVSVDDIKNKISEKTKAIIVVHYAGYSCDMDGIVDLAKKNNIVLIEDVAHAVGASYKGKKCGTFGDLACFSFFSNKNLSVGEGGMLVSKSKKMIEDAKLLKSHGMTSMTIDRHEGKSTSYDVVKPGYNYRLDEIRAALGIVQLQKLDESNNLRKELVNYYREKIKSIDEIIVPFEKVEYENESSYHVFPIMLPENINRNIVMNYMKSRGIQTSIHYPKFKSFSYYKDIIKEDIKTANEISDRVLTLPLYPNLKTENIDYILKNLQEVLRKIG